MHLTVTILPSLTQSMTPSAPLYIPSCLSCSRPEAIIPPPDFQNTPSQGLPSFSLGRGIPNGRVCNVWPSSRC
ncbi:hypothetical protein EI94DRAFT_1734648 [Lactarius quietus]|nr:hypothetical protein EI94DRAFT_1734648 [Lactarius quietus]